MDGDTQIERIDLTPDPDNVEMEEQARHAAQVLATAYPDHLWAVGWAPGKTLVIKNLAMDGRFGFTIDYARAFSASDLKHTILNAGGELLERAGMPRGRWNGEFAAHLDGQEAALMGLKH